MNQDEAFKPGDHVEWNSPQGKVKGKAIKKLTSETHIKGHKVSADPEHPEYLVESEKTGKQAAHHADALKKLHN